ncbi:MAG: Sapep family Mn(2+)-dependent dipeptidase [Clostridia bacterium]|nr:Sapep family Mn(2+)-dependent dipeptidase [Clostridia bacterium]
MIDKKIDDLFTEWLEKNKDEIIGKWIELVKIPSIKSERAEKAPYGIECAKALNFAASLFDSEGIDSKVYDEGGYALASYGTGEKTIGLYSHSDVVPVGDGWLFTEPFNPVIKDGSLIGRGAEDNKSGIIASLCLMKFLKDSGVKLGSRIEAFIGSDEECGMEDMKAYLAEQTVPDISFVPDADFPCSTGEKGICHIWAKNKTAFKDIKNIKAGEAFNIVLDKIETEIVYSDGLYNEIEEKLTGNEKITLSRENGMIKLLAKGISKHASIPEGSENAALTLFSFLCGCENLCENDRYILKNAVEALSCYYGKGLNILHEDPNFGKTTCTNGMVKIEDEKLMLSFDIRYGDTQDAAELEKNSAEALDGLGFVIVYKDNSPGFSIDKDSKIPAILEGIFAEITGEYHKSVLMSGGTYARKLKNAFSLGTSVILPERKDKVLEMPEGHGGPHQRDERIDIEGFFTAVRILLHYVIESDKIING